MLHPLGGGHDIGSPATDALDAFDEERSDVSAANAFLHLHYTGSAAKQRSTGRRTIEIRADDFEPSPFGRRAAKRKLVLDRHLVLFFVGIPRIENVL